MTLDRIVGRKKLDVARRQESAPLSRFRGRLRSSERSLRSALRGPETSYILECKKASPSAGVLREDFDPAAIARSYADTAAAISVLADQPFFRGSLEHLGQARGAVDLPILCKDFILEPYQVYEARLFGADAVLLMLSVLDDRAYRECVKAATSLDVDTLTEVHDDAELDRALALGAPIVGINNRNLSTLEVDIATTQRLAPEIPRERAVVCESGISSHRQVRALREHVDAFLVGTAMMLHPNAAVASRELIYGRVKVCGLGRAEDARAAWRSGATYGGLIFVKASPRYVDPSHAAALCEVAPLAWVGVFQDHPIAEVVAMAEKLGLKAVQLHGDEPRDYVEALRRDLRDSTEIWKAWPVRDQLPTRAETGADRILLDTYDAQKRGGTGRTFDWTLLADHPDLDRIIVAGGLTPENAAAADAVGGWGLDVSSGVEATPGIKDASRLRAFFAALRGGKSGGAR